MGWRIKSTEVIIQTLMISALFVLAIELTGGFSG
jgi:hypothetical protein